MKVHGWCARLDTQLPGWFVWHSGPGGDQAAPVPGGWWAVPAPAGTTLTIALTIAGPLGPFRRPQDLRDAARERYGWDDHCDTCGVLARTCGHRQPEREKARAAL